MPVLHMSRCCVLRRLILRLQPGRAASARQKQLSGVVDGDAYVSDIGAVLRLEIDMT